MNAPADSESVRSEIEDLHAFFVDWFSGRAPADDALFEDRFARRFAPEFVMIPPAGTLLRLADVLAGIRASHGSNPDFRIAIRHVAIHARWDDCVLATYEEWQRNALASDPPDNGRIASVILQRSPAWRWRSVHETWLPPEVIAAGPYDF